MYTASKANPQTIVSDRLSLMQQQTLNLKREKNNLYSHLCELLTHLPLSSDSNNRKIDSVKQLAAISEFVKKSTYRDKQAEPLPEDKLNELISRRNQHPLWFQKKRQLLAYNQKTLQDSVKQNAELQNFQKSHKSLFLPAGLSFSQQQALRINIAIKKLRQKVNATKIRFWGKILTRKSDYYVIQGVVNKKYDQKVDEGAQKYSQGVNLYSYWVNNLSMLNEWYELPLITPAQLKTSRLIKYTFTGDLHAQIKSYPKFIGKEEHLLKCQLVRITHNCEIAPKGLYGPTEQNPDDIQYAEDFKMPEFSQLSNLQNWVHLNPYILELGRSTYWTDPKLLEDQRDQLINKLIQTDPKQQRLKQINQDKPPSEPRGVETSWFTKQIGSVQLYNNVGKDEGSTSCYGLIMIKNINWPGWVTVTGLGMYDSIYVGYGYKATQAAFYPMGCDDLQIQGEDVGENDEPNPRNPPDELEPDSDDENKKPQE